MSPAPKSCPIEQEEKIVAAAVACIEESSLLDFTMSGIAKRAEMSMGSIYKHMHSKEDVLVALSVRMSDCLASIFDRVFNTPMTMPEQLIAMSLLNYNKVDLYPFSRHLEMLMSGDALLKRASSFWVEKLVKSGDRLTELFMARGDRAIAEGELTPQGEANTNLNQLMLGCWALCVGHIQVNLQTASRTPNQESAQLPFPLAADDPHVNNCQRLINSYQWRQPLDNAGITKAIDTLKALNYY